MNSNSACGPRQEIVALAQHQIEALPGQRHEIEPGRAAPPTRVAMPQSARPARTACAMSGPVGQAGLTALSASNAMPGAARAAPAAAVARRRRCGRSAMPRASCRDVGDVGEPERIARRHQQPLLAAGEGDHHRVVQAGRAARPRRYWRSRRRRRCRCRWIAAAITSPRASRRRPASLPSGRLASPQPLSRNAHSSSGSWLPPTIGGAGAAPAPRASAGRPPASGRARPSGTASGR